MKYMNKLVFVNVILIIFFLSISIKPVYADEGVSDIVSGADEFVESGGNTRVDEVKLKNFSNTMANTLLNIGVAVAVIYSVVLGIKYMIGSMEEKAEIKESIIPFIIGCIVLFGSFTIWKIAVIVGNRLQG